MYKFKRAFIVGFASVILFMVSGCGGAKIELSFEKESYEVTVGEELELMPTVKNADEKDYALKFSSEDEDIATYVDGVVKGVGAGQVTVRVELEDNEKIFAEAIIKVVEAKKFTVTFDTAGGSEIDPVEVVEGEKLTRPSDPTKAGHEFAGWFKDAATTEAFDFDAPITAAITLYAKWAIKVYTVAFETNGGSAIDPVSVNHGAKVEEPETPIREGFEFTGWFIDEDLTDPFDFENAIASDLTLYAGWEKKSYTVSFNTDGASGIDSQTVFHGEKATEPDEPTKAGYSFVGWFKDPARTEEFDFNAEITADTVLFAKWELVEVSARLVTNGGFIDELTLTFAPKDSATPYEQELGFFNDGYNATNAEKSIFLYEGDHPIFGGDGEGVEPAWWGYKIALTQIAPNAFIVENHIGNEKDVPQGVYDYILVGLWRPNLYPGFSFVMGLAVGDVLVIEGVDFAGEGGPVEATIKKYGPTAVDNYFAFTIAPETELPEPTKRGFTFVGWYDNPAFSGEPVAKISKDTSATAFYAKWEEADRLTVTFDTGDETVVIHPVFRFPGDTLKRPIDPVREGFEFVGWFSDADGAVPFDFDSEIDADITLYAKWEETAAEE